MLATPIAVTVVAQRLVRLLCRNCRTPGPVPEEFLCRLRASEGKITVFRRSRRGCEMCSYTGYVGQTPVHEVLVVDDNIRGVLSDRPSRKRIRRLARESGMSTLRECAVDLVRHGDTSIGEVIHQVS